MLERVGHPFARSGVADPRGATALAELLARATAIDAVTLWNLLRVVAPADRGHVHDRLAALVPPPDRADRDAVIAGDDDALTAWWLAIEEAWLYGARPGNR